MLTNPVSLPECISPKKGDPVSPRIRFRRKALFCFLALTVALGAPGSARGQYSSGGYSRPGGGSTSSYSAPSRRAPVSSSGGYSRRVYAGSGYATGSLGDQAVSRSLSSQALRDYRAAQRPAETYARRPPAYAGGSGWLTEAPPRPPIWGGEEPTRRVARGPALAGSGPLTAVALWAALNSLSSPGSAAYFHNYQYDPGYVQWRREADREAGHNPPVAAKLDQLDAQLAQMEDQPRNPSAPAPVRPSRAPGGSGFIWPVLFISIVILLLLWLWRRRMALPVVARAVPGLGGAPCRRADQCDEQHDGRIEGDARSRGARPRLGGRGHGEGKIAAPDAAGARRSEHRRRARRGVRQIPGAAESERPAGSPQVARRRLNIFLLQGTAWAV